jgi:hypothetical protein
MDDHGPRAHVWLPDLMIAKDPSGYEYEILRDHETIGDDLPRPKSIMQDLGSGDQLPGIP